GWEDQLGAVHFDHAGHVLLDFNRLGDFLDLENLDARQLLDGRGALGVGLVVAVVVLGANVKEADGDISLGLAVGLNVAFAAAARRAERQEKEESWRPERRRKSKQEPN